MQDPTHAGHNRSMLYDNLNRLVNVTAGAHWTSASYTYDVLDNLRTSQLVKGSGTDTYAYAYDPAKNRPTSIAKTGIAAWTYLVDTRGNVTEDGRRKYTWTRGDRLASIRTMADVVQESYLYDGHGRRVVTWRADDTSAVPVYGLDGKVRMTADNRKGGLTSHIYLGDDNIADVFRRWSDGQMTTTYLHTDALGSPIARTNAAGAVIGRSVYAPYGQVVDNPADPNDNEVEGIGYTGHLYDAVTDLVYMQQRYYDPAIGRFLSVDPMKTDYNTGGTFNRYYYANNNPYKFVDPDGRYGRGANWSNDDWKLFDRAQRRAAVRLENAAEELNEAMAAGGSELNSVKKKFERTFGAGSGTIQNMTDVATALTSMAGALTDDGSNGHWASQVTAAELAKLTGRDATSSLAAAEVGGTNLYVNSEHSQFRTFSELVRASGHESGHNFGLRDQTNAAGIPAYFNGNSLQQDSFKNLPSAKRLVNPDHLMEFSR